MKDHEQPGTAFDVIGDVHGQLEDWPAPYHSSLLLGAIGDALGAPIEFDSAETISRKHGVDPPSDLAYAGPAHITDDTQMTLFMAEGLLRALREGTAHDRDTFRREATRSLVHWLATQDERVNMSLCDRDSPLLAIPQLHHRRAPGLTCLSACVHLHEKGHLPDFDRPLNDSKGCGAVMRSAPYGLLATSAAQAFDWACDAGVLTHGHPSGYLSAGTFAALVHGLSRGLAYDAALGEAEAFLAGRPGSDEAARALQEARQASEDGHTAYRDMVALGEGWIAEEALAIAVAITRTADATSEADIRRALWLSVRHSGDSDSTGALVGNLLGATCPADAIPRRWAEQLEIQSWPADWVRSLP